MGCRRTFEFDDRASSRRRNAVCSGTGRTTRSIAKFIQNELDTEEEKVTLLHQNISQKFMLSRLQQATATGSIHTRLPETLSKDISKNNVAEEDPMLRWFV